MLKYGSLVVAVLLFLSSAGLAQDWPTVSHVEHSTYQAVNADGSPAYDGTFPVRMVGVVLNNSEDWLDPTAAYDSGVHLWQMGGQAEIYVQAIDLDGTAWDPNPGAAYTDFGGTAAWMGQNYGNHIMHQDPLFNYTDAEWTAELGRLNLYGGDGATSPIRAGDLVEIRARGGLHYKGKYNVNEQHDNDYDRYDNWDGPGSAGDGQNHDFEIVRLVEGFGLPTAAALDLADLKNADDSFIFDSTRQTGCERYQATLVELQDVWVASAVSWTGDSDITVTDGTRTFEVHLGLSSSFDGTELFGVGEHFDVVGIMDQSSSHFAYATDGYQLLVMNAADVTPEPATLILLALGGMGLLRRRR